MHMHVSVFDSMHCMLQYRSKWIQNKGVCLLVFLIVCTVMSVCSVVYVSVVSVIVKRPVLPLCVVDGRSRNPLYYYYYLTLVCVSI